MKNITKSILWTQTPGTFTSKKQKSGTAPAQTVQNPECPPGPLKRSKPTNQQTHLPVPSGVDTPRRPSPSRFFPPTSPPSPSSAPLRAPTPPTRRPRPMNTSQFMDKQILGLAASASPSLAGGGGSGGAELLDLMGPDPQEETEDLLRRRRHHSSNGAAAADVLPSYDFQTMRTAAAAPAPASSWGSLDSNSRAASSPYNLKVLTRPLDPSI